MTFIDKTIALGETLPVPDGLSRAAIAWLVARTDRRLASSPTDADCAFAEDMERYPIALHADDANAQHYEIPAAFFEMVLGPHRKYSCCLFDSETTTLAEAEERAIRATAENAGLSDGQSILELGCGWGSLSLWAASRYPNARIVAVSNSASQRAFILGQAGKLGVSNLDVVTADINDFDTSERFDRVVSVEMFEHVANWRALLARVHQWLAPDGRAFVHVFAHRDTPYRFDHSDPGDWIAQHFFTGGIMPSHGLIKTCSERFTVEREWRWNGEHYRRTAEAWLANFDARSDEIDQIFSSVYGAKASLWKRRWRFFFLATMGLFGHNGGRSWGISQYRLTAG